MIRFIPDPGSFFYVVAKQQKEEKNTRVLDDGNDTMVMTTSIDKPRDRSYEGYIFSAVALDTFMVLGKLKHGSKYSDGLTKFAIEHWDFIPIGPEILNVLRKTEDWKE